jgi:quercetin dioxygenase-like cupin family protein
MMQDDPARARSRTTAEIRQRGAIFNVNEGIEVEDGEGCVTRLVGWPANGTRMVSFHVLTHRPGGSYALHAHPISEESLICLSGRGEVNLGRGWIPVEAGNFVYVPAGVEHATRAARDASQDFVVLAYHCPPALEYYQSIGFFRDGAFSQEAIDEALLRVRTGDLPDQDFPMRPNDLGGEERAEVKGRERVQREGGIFNLFRGARFTENGGLMRFVMWPGSGTRLVGQHVAFHEPGVAFLPHVHPISEDAILVAQGEGRGYLESRWVPVRPGDIIYAPAGVRHGTGAHAGAPRLFVCTGCASPPQFDLYERAGYLKEGRFTDFAWM